MKKQTIFFSGLRVVIVSLSFLAVQTPGWAQNNEAQAQPVRKTTTGPVTNTSNAKPAAWEKQQIQPANNKPTSTSAKSNAKPGQPQPNRPK